VQTARTLVGIPYRWGGDSPEEGFDCSGLTWYTYAHAGVSLPRSAREQYRLLLPVAREQVRPGDLVFFRPPPGRGWHVGIYVGDNLFIHAPSTGKTVRYTSLTNPYWQAAYLGAGRIPAALRLQQT
jgi:murein DD-endopeptidase